MQFDQKLKVCKSQLVPRSYSYFLFCLETVFGISLGFQRNNVFWDFTDFASKLLFLLTFSWSRKYFLIFWTSTEIFPQNHMILSWQSENFKLLVQFIQSEKNSSNLRSFRLTLKSDWSKLIIIFLWFCVFLDFESCKQAKLVTTVFCCFLKKRALDAKYISQLSASSDVFQDYSVDSRFNEVL